MTPDYRDILHQYWGYDDFRGIQREIIESVGSGQDTLGLMPTGGGKSITFQVPALAKDGICIVVTPLIALMKDQVQNLRRRGIKATAVYSGMRREEIVTALENCIFGNYKFLYVSPERLMTQLFLSKFRVMKVSFITVDESHCISQWGYDFRPAYLNIADIRSFHPEVPILALTATATPEVVQDIQEKLQFRNGKVFRMSFERTNLAYVVRACDDKPEELAHILRKTQGSSIVYVRSRARAKETAEGLKKEGITAEYYHAGLTNEEKDKLQKGFHDNAFRVMVATNAFGMGIDKPDVRVVVHIDLPDSIEAYFQEAGRAGRDGEKAYAVILYSRSDKTTLQKRIVDAFPDKDYIREVYEKLSYYLQIAMGSGQGRIFEFELEEFCRNFKFFPLPAEGALKLLTQAGYIEYIEEQDNASRLHILATREELYHLQQLSPETDALLQMVLRSYTGLFSDFVFIHERSLAIRLGTTADKVYQQLITLAKRHVIEYIPRKKTPYILYTRDREEKELVRINRTIYEERRKNYEQQIRAMVEYTTRKDACRSRILLHYFGEKNEHDCGHCDVCIARHKEELSDESYTLLRFRIKTTLSEYGPLTPAQLRKILDTDSEPLAKAVTYLLNEEEIFSRNGMLSLSGSGQK